MCEFSTESHISMYQWSNVKTYTHHRKIAENMQENKFEVKKDDTLFCVCKDGSPHSEFAFEITIQDLIKETDKLFVVHIYNQKMDEYYNFRKTLLKGRDQIDICTNCTEGCKVWA